VQKQFAVLYRWRIDPAHEDQFRRRWLEATMELRERFGALGSCLSRDAEGNFVAFARWPSEEQRDCAVADRPNPDRLPGVVAFEQTNLWVEDDLLLWRGRSGDGTRRNSAGS
jgi:hypothetical protein